MNSPTPSRLRAISRSDRNGEISETSAITPASTNSRATSATRLMFSIRASLVKPRSRLRPWRRLSPSSNVVWRPRSARRLSTRLAMVDFPAPLSPVSQSTQGRCHFRRLPADIGRAAQREIDHSRGRDAVAEAIDQNETAEIAIVAIGLADQRPVEGEMDVADLVGPEGGRGLMLHGVDRDAVLQGRDHRARGGAAAFEHIATARNHGVIVEPDEMRGELIRDQRCRGGYQHVAAADIDFVGEDQRHRLTRYRGIVLAGGGDDLGDMGEAA